MSGDPVTDAGLPATRFALMRRPALIAGGIALMVIAWFAFAPQQDELNAVQNGQRFSSAERRQAEKTLKDAGITGVQSRGAQLMVPRSALAASDAVLERSANADHAAAEQLTSANSLLDQFATGRRQERADAAARAAQIGRLLAQLPGVESAEIVWDEQPRIGRRQPPRVLATVFLKPETGCTIGLDTVLAVRSAVAGSRAHLAATDVAVMDMQRKVTYRGDLDTAAYSEEVRQTEITTDCRARLSKALADIDGVKIDVALRPADPVALPAQRHEPFAGVSGPNLRLEVRPVTQTAAFVPDPDTEEQRAAATPAQQFDVSVEVPATYIVKVAVATAGAEAGSMSSREVAAFREYVRRSIESDVRNRVAPALAESPSDLAPARLTVRLAMPAEAQWPVPAGSAGPAWLAWDWPGARSVFADLQKRGTATGWGLVALAVFVAGVFARFRRRRGAPMTRTATPRPPAAFLPGIDVAVWAPVVARESVSVIAGMLPKLPPEEVSQLLTQLGPTQQRAVLELAPTAALDERRLGILRRRIRAELESMPTATVSDELQPTRTYDDVTAEAFAPPATPPLIFDELVKLDEVNLQLLAGRVHPETWSAALVGASPKLHRRLSAINRISDALPGRHDRRPLRLRDIETAQRLIVDEWRAMQPQR